MDIAKFLATIKLFESLSGEARTELASACAMRAFPSGAVVFSEGDPADGFYAVVSGRVRVYKSAPDGKEQTLHLFGPPNVVGEAAVFSGGAFPAHAQAIEKSELLYLPRPAFLAFISARPEVALSMLGLMAKRLMQFTTLIEQITLREAPSRLATYLLYLSERQQTGDLVEFDTTKAQLAGLLGTTPETLSRMLTRLANEGATEPVDAKRLRLVDRAFLEQLSAGNARLG